MRVPCSPAAAGNRVRLCCSTLPGWLPGLSRPGQLLGQQVVQCQTRLLTLCGRPTQQYRLCMCTAATGFALAAPAAARLRASRRLAGRAGVALTPSRSCRSCVLAAHAAVWLRSARRPLHGAVLTPLGLRASRVDRAVASCRPYLHSALALPTVLRRQHRRTLPNCDFTPAVPAMPRPCTIVWQGFELASLEHRDGHAPAPHLLCRLGRAGFVGALCGRAYHASGGCGDSARAVPTRPARCARVPCQRCRTCLGSA